MQVIPVQAVQRGFGQTSRRDAWWAVPLGVFLGLSSFLVYTTWAMFQAAALRIRTVSLPALRSRVLG